jgi:hypothetical protein
MVGPKPTVGMTPAPQRGFSKAAVHDLAQQDLERTSPVTTAARPSTTRRDGIMHTTRKTEKACFLS